MNWQILYSGCAVAVAIAGLMNYLMLNAIKVAILEQTQALKDWARSEFAGARETDRRLVELEHFRKARFG